MTINFLANAISMWQAADEAFSRSENSEHYRESHLAASKTYAEEARTQALLSIASDLHRIADRLDMLCAVGIGYEGNEIAALRVSTQR